MILTLLRIGAFFISTLGYTRLLENKLKYYAKLTWVVVFSLNILVVYFSAFVIRMDYAVWVMFALGIIFFIYHLIKEGKSFIFALLKPDMVKVLMGFYLILFSWTLLHSTLVHYDNFSHWATIVKFFVYQSTLPTAQDAIISFSSYPIGASLFVYYFTMIVGYSEGVMLLGQFVFVMSCLYALFAFVKDNRRVMLVVVVFFIVAGMNYFNIAIRHNNLLVDFLLPVLSLASISGLHLFQRDIRKMSFHLVVTLSVLIIIKNSAMFFAALAIIYYLYLVIRYHRKASSLVWVVFSLALTFLPYLLWRHHVGVVFASIESKHNISFSVYIKNFDAKSTAIIQEIGHLFINASLSLNSLSFQGILLINALFIGLSALVRFYGHQKFPLIRYLLGINSVFLIYYVGIFLMFVFSMPLAEARELAGFERYASSVVVFGLGLFALICVVYVNRILYVDQAKTNYRSFRSLGTKFVYQYASLFMLFVAVCLLLSENNGMLYNMNQSKLSLPEQVREVTGDNSIYNKTKYLLVASDEEGDITSFYLQYVGRYYLYSNNVEAYSKYEMENSEFIKILEKYEYVIIVNKNYTFIEKIRQTTGMKVDKSIYKVSEILMNLKKGRSIE